MPLLIKNGRAELRNDKTGSLIRSFGSNVIDGDYDPNEELVLLVMRSGKVELRSSKTGSLKRTFPGPCDKATFSEGEVLLRKDDGRHELRRIATGSLIRSY